MLMQLGLPAKAALMQLGLPAKAGAHERAEARETSTLLSTAGSSEDESDGEAEAAGDPRPRQPP